MHNPEIIDSPTYNEQLLQSAKNPGLLGGLLAFFQDTQKWWMLPPILLLILLGCLLALSQTAAAPFIYTLF